MPGREVTFFGHMQQVIDSLPQEQIAQAEPTAELAEGEVLLGRISPAAQALWCLAQQSWARAQEQVNFSQLEWGADVDALERQRGQSLDKARQYEVILAMQLRAEYPLVEGFTQLRKGWLLVQLSTEQVITSRAYGYRKSVTSLL